MNDNYKTLITIPSSDGNFQCSLKYATDEELLKTEKYLTENPHHNIARLKAVAAEIKRRKADVKNEQN